MHQLGKGHKISCTNPPMTHALWYTGGRGQGLLGYDLVFRVRRGAGWESCDCATVTFYLKYENHYDLENPFVELFSVSDKSKSSEDTEGRGGMC